MLDNKCPRCFSVNELGVTELRNKDGVHYQCNDPNCRNEITGERTQFKIVYDKEVHFPYNVIFKNRDKEEYYRKPYLVISSPGISVQRSQSLTASSD